MSTDRPDDVDAEFARLVAGYDDPPAPQGEGVATQRPWPASEDVDDADESSDSHESDVEEPAQLLSGGLVISSTDPLNTEATWEDEGHFVPPTPPPLPRLDPLMLLAWLGVVGSVFIAVVATLVGWVIPQLLLIAMIVGFIGGIVVLIARLSREPPDPDHPDDGAVV